MTERPVHPSEEPSVVSPYLLLLLPPLFWSMNAVIGRFAMAEMPAMVLSFSRWALALAILAPIAWVGIRAHWRTVVANWGYLAFIGLLSVTTYNSMLYLALRSTTAINATLVNSAMPMVIILFARPILGETMTRRQMTGVGIAFVGVLAVITRGDIEVLLGLDLRQGDLLMLIAICAWAMHSVMLRKRHLSLPPIPFLTVQIAFGVLFIVPFFFVERALMGPVELGPNAWWVIPFTAVFPAILAFYFWNRGVRAVGASTAGQFIYFIPLFTAILAVIFLGEGLYWYHFLAAALIFGGVWLATKSKPSPEVSASD